MKTKTLFIIATIAVPCLWTLNWIAVKWYYTSGQDAGTFGDLFGASNALFSGLTIIGLLYTIYLQQNEIKNARTQHDEQKHQVKTLHDEQKHQAQVHFDEEKNYLVEQIKIQNRVKFETTFFRLIDMSKDNLEYILGDVGYIAISQIEQTRKTGRDAIIELIERFTMITSGQNPNYNVSFDSGGLYFEFESLLGMFNAKNYVTNLRNIYIFIEQSTEVDIKEKLFYITIITANITLAERWLLYLSTFEFSQQRFAGLLAKYNIMYPEANPFQLDQRVINILNDITLRNKPKD